MKPRTTYASDLTDAQYALLAPLLPPETAPSGRGRRRNHSHREILNGIFYLLRTGCQWRLLPHDLPPWGIVYHYYYQWRKRGVWERIHDALREQVRQQEGKEATPSVLLIDSQSVKTTEKGDLKNLRKLLASREASLSKGESVPSSPTPLV